MKNRIFISLMVLSLIPILTAPAGAQDYAFTYTCDNQGDIIYPDSLGPVSYTHLRAHET